MDFYGRGAPLSEDAFKSLTDRLGLDLAALWAVGKVAGALPRCGSGPGTGTRRLQAYPLERQFCVLTSALPPQTLALDGLKRVLSSKRVAEGRLMRHLVAKEPPERTKHLDLTGQYLLEANRAPASQRWAMNPAAVEGVLREVEGLRDRFKDRPTVPHAASVSTVSETKTLQPSPTDS